MDDPASTPPESPLPESPLIGQTLGNWELVRLIGSGGYGAVYEGRGTVNREARAAVKVLHEYASFDAQVKARFLREAAAASRAEHPHIIELFDGGESREGHCYTAMELLDGASLKDTLRRSGKLALGRAIHLGIQVADALGAAHALGIVHRDLKPDNIFLTPRDGDPDFVKVLDFGIAKLMGGDGAGVLSVAGQAMGTPRYMSPEQWRVLPDVDGRADIYALGQILYESLAGERPFPGSTAFALMNAHLALPVPRLSDKVTVPPVLDALVTRMMAKERDQRPPSMAAVKRVLEAIETKGDAEAALAEALPAAAIAEGAPTEKSVPVGAEGRATEKLAPVLPDGTATETSVPVLPDGTARKTAAPSSPAIEEARATPARRGTGRLVLLCVGLVVLAGLAILLIRR